MKTGKNESWPSLAAAENRPLKYTLCVTQRCNLACSYCYIAKTGATMSIATAQKILDFIFRHAPSGRDIEIGFFGGEPLLEFELIQAIVNLIERHPSNNEGRVSFTLTTNGTIFSDSIKGRINDKVKREN
jgi:uncharacterized protein